MTRKLILAAALAATGIAGGAAFASAVPQAPAAAGARDYSAAQQPRRGLARADANGDGIVTKQEYLAAATRKFDKLDRNHDGKLDASEMAARGDRGGGRGMRGDDGGPRNYQ